MIKLLKLIYINILGICDLNRILISKQRNYKDNSESKLLIMVILFIISCIFLYKVFNNVILLNLNNKYYLLTLAFFISSIVVLINNIMNIPSILFKGKDNDVMYSFPISKDQIILSKLFNVYIRNLLLVLLIMFPAIFAFNTNITINETLGFIYLLNFLVVPLIPIVLATFISYYDCYLKLNLKNKIFYNVVKWLILMIIFILLNFWIEKNIVLELDNILRNISFIYPLTYIFHLAISKFNVLCIILSIILPILLVYFFVKYLSSNYIKMYSIVKGVRKKKCENYKYKSYGAFFGLLKKEFINLVSNKINFSQTIIKQLVLCLTFIIICLVLSNSEFIETEVFFEVFELFMPCLLAFIATSNCTTISSLSLEGQMMQMLKAFPLKFERILMIKWIFNIILVVPFIFLNVIVLILCFKIDMAMVFMCLLLPFIAMCFVSLLGLVLDYRFVNLKNENEVVILKQRMIGYIPSIISIFIVILPVILPLYTYSMLILAFYTFVFAIGIVICLIYLLINKKKLEKRLLK